MSERDFPRAALLQPDFQPVGSNRLPVSRGGSSSNQHKSQKPDSESLVREQWYQLGLQQLVRGNEGLYSIELDSDTLEDSLDINLDKQEETAYDTNQYTTGLPKSVGDGRKQEPEDKYFELRYEPNWKNMEKGAQFLKARNTPQVAGGSNLDTFYLHSPKEKQEEAKPQDALSGLGTQLPGFHEPRAVVSSKPLRLHTKGREQAGDCHSKDNPSTRGINFSNPPQRAKEDYVKKNKQTLGLHSERKNSYLQLHDKKQVLKKQVTDPKTVDEEGVQRLPPLQAVKMDPEDTWYLKVQQCKEHQNKLSHRRKIKSNLNFQGRAFPRNDSQQPLGRPAKTPCQLPPLQAAPMLTAKQDNNSTPQKRLYPHPPAHPKANTSGNSDTSLSNLLNLRCRGNQDFTTSTCPVHLMFHEPNPAEMLSPAHTNKENEKCQRGFPNGLPHVCQCSDNPVTVNLPAIENSPKGWPHLNWKNTAPTYVITFREPVQEDQGSLQGCKGRTYVDKMCRYSPIASLCSPTVAHRIFPPLQTVEQHPQDSPRLPAPPSAEKRVFSPLPPLLPRIQSVSEVNPESSKGNQVAINQNNSEGFPMQREKRTQSKAGKKSRCSKAYKNMDIRLGGLGPDYETIKEKKEKLKQQKEYAKQVQERNMKNMTLVQRVDTKPKVIPPTSRQKALEYAKTIPKPKNFKARRLDGEVREERVQPRMLDGASLQEIASLETLQSRHEKEKQAVAAFRKL